MNTERLKRLQAQVRIGGKGTPRRKKKVMHQTAATDDKKLQSSLKKLSVSTIPGIEEVNIIKEDLTVIHFNNPKAQASLSANTFAVTGHGESRKIVEMLPEILPQLGQETVVQLKMFANSLSKSQKEVIEGRDSNILDNADDDVPLLVNDFDEIAKKDLNKHQTQSTDRQARAKGSKFENRRKVNNINASLINPLQKTDEKIGTEVNATREYIVKPEASASIKGENDIKDQIRTNTKGSGTQPTTDLQQMVSVKESECTNENKGPAAKESAEKNVLKPHLYNKEENNRKDTKSILIPDIDLGDVVENARHKIKNIDEKTLNTSEEISHMESIKHNNKNPETITKCSPPLKNEREDKAYVCSKSLSSYETLLNTQPSKYQIEAAENEFNDHKHLIELKLTDDLIALACKNDLNFINCDKEIDDTKKKHQLSLSPNALLCFPDKVIAESEEIPPPLKLFNEESKKENADIVQAFFEETKKKIEPASLLQNLTNTQKIIESKENQCETLENIQMSQGGTAQFSSSNVENKNVQAQQRSLKPVEANSALNKKMSSDIVTQNLNIASNPVEELLPRKDIIDFEDHQDLNLTSVENQAINLEIADQAIALQLPLEIPSIIRPEKKKCEEDNDQIQTKSDHANNSKGTLQPQKGEVSGTNENISQSSFGTDLHCKSTIRGSLKQKCFTKKDTVKPQITSTIKSDKKKHDVNAKAKQVSTSNSGVKQISKLVPDSTFVKQERPSNASKAKQMSSQARPQAINTTSKPSTCQPKKIPAVPPSADQRMKTNDSTKISSTLTPQAASSSKARPCDGNNQKAHKKISPQPEIPTPPQNFSQDAPKSNQ